MLHPASLPGFAHGGYQADPELTSIGKDQVATVHKEWNAERPFGIPFPQKLYCSPLTRAMQSCEITFRDIVNTRCVVVEVIFRIRLDFIHLMYYLNPELS